MQISGPNLAGDFIDRFKAPVENVKERIFDFKEDIAPSTGEVAQIGLNTIKSDTRELNSEERAIAQKYYGDSIDLDRVRVNESSTLSALSGLDPQNDGARPFVLGNSINFPDGYNLDSPKDRGTFIHELAHIWQFQNTKGFAVQIEGAQLVRDPKNYDIDTDLLEDVENFHNKFNIEQQAELVQGYYLLETHAQLTAQKEALTSVSFDVQLSELSRIDEHLEEIESKGVFQDLTNARITTEDLRPFIDEIQSFKPREGLTAEIHEAADEILDSGFSSWEVVEGSVEVQREIGEAALKKTGNAIVDGLEAAGDAASDIGDVVTGRWSPFR